MISKTYYDRYVQILKEELIPAMGCTEPIAIAYASAIAAKHLGVRPDAVQVEVSGNIIKNAKSVVVPNTGGLRGIPAAAAAGIVAGDPSRELKVIAQASLQDIERIRQFLRDVPITVSQANTGNIFDIRVTVFNGTQSSSVHICDFHTNVREIRKNGDIVFTRDNTANTDPPIALAITSGMVCDGAKASCAAKIATAVDAGILGYHMYKNGQQFWGGDGIVTKGVENTIVNIGQLARNGMSETDKEILRIMTRC